MQPRSKANLQTVSDAQLLDFIRRLKKVQTGPSNSQTDVVEEVVKLNSPTALHIMFRSMSKNIDLFQVRHIIEPSKPQTMSCSVGREGVVNCIRKQAEYCVKIPVFEFPDVIEMIRHKACWQQDQFTN